MEYIENDYKLGCTDSLRQHCWSNENALCQSARTIIARLA